MQPLRPRSRSAPCNAGDGSSTSSSSSMHAQRLAGPCRSSMRQCALLDFNQWLCPPIQRRFSAIPTAPLHVRGHASPCLGQGLCGRRSPSPPTCVDAARPRSVRPRQGLRQACAGRLPFLPAGIVRVATPFPRRPRAPLPPLQVRASASMRRAQPARAPRAQGASSRAPAHARRARPRVCSLGC
jgi:hypothetical protein